MYSAITGLFNESHSQSSSTIFQVSLISNNCFLTLETRCAASTIIGLIVPTKYHFIRCHAEELGANIATRFSA